MKHIKISIPEPRDILSALPIRWVVSEGEEDPGELGLRVGPLVFSYYKDSSPLVERFRKGKFREVHPREFGEVIKNEG